MIEKKKYKSVKKNEFRQKMKNQRIISLPSQFPPRAGISHRLIAKQACTERKTLSAIGITHRPFIHVARLLFLLCPRSFVSGHLCRSSFPSSSSSRLSRLEDRWEAARKIAYTGRRRLVIKKSAAPLIRIHRSFRSLAEELLHLGKGGEGGGEV